MIIYINARFLTQRLTGVQRFAVEISKELKKINPKIKFVSPANIIHKEEASILEAETYGKLSSHTWEQIELRSYLKNANNTFLICLSFFR